jgi:hypothetical protein
MLFSLNEIPKVFQGFDPSSVFLQKLVFIAILDSATIKTLSFSCKLA